jgi:hypothetical protein
MGLANVSFCQGKKTGEKIPNRYVDDWNEVGGWAESGRTQRGREGREAILKSVGVSNFSADQNKLDYVRVPCFALNS